LLGINISQGNALADTSNSGNFYQSDSSVSLLCIYADLTKAVPHSFRVNFITDFGFVLLCLEAKFTTSAALSLKLAHELNVATRSGDEYGIGIATDQREG
jgi:hypothetical protein